MTSFHRFAILAAFPLVTASCLTGTEPAEPLLWEGLFVAVPGPDGIEGSAAMVALQLQTEAGVGISMAPPAVSLGWIVRTGTCASEGSAVAAQTAFPAIAVDSGGAGTRETTIQRRLTGTEYAVEIRENADGSGPVLACADLNRLQ